jgi:hypothetical protein
VDADLLTRNANASLTVQVNKASPEDEKSQPTYLKHAVLRI